MKLDLTLSNVDPGNPTFQVMLNDLQANIIKGHGRKYAYHIFLKLKPDKVADAKSWIARFSKEHITSAFKLEQHRQAWKTSGIDGGPVFTLSISATGYAMLGFEEEQLPVEMETTANSIVRDPAAFNKGAKANAIKLGDGDITNWEEPFRHDIDLLITVADSAPGKALQLSQNIISEVAAFSHLLVNQKGQLLHRKAPAAGTGEGIIAIEHFGYADGVSQPLYFKDDIVAQASINAWNDKEPLNLVIVPDPNGKTEDSFGSFLVFRKLEQDVAAFMKAEETKLPVIKDAEGKINQDLPGAMIVGRFRNGNPVVISNGKTGHITSSNISNDFDNSTDPKVISDVAAYSSKCPYFSHIRLTNPRMDITVVPPAFAHSVRLTRRGIPYDDINRFGPGQEDLVDPSEDQLNTCRPSSGVGLLFMSYHAHIGKQFEFIQNNWANHGHIAGHNVGPDSVIGQVSPVPPGLPFRPATPDLLPKKLPVQWGQDVSPSSPGITFNGFVKMKGGEYFFTPSISFLQSLSEK
ncbi:MAG: hypothetical protein ABIN01_20590 [Ferruginibacter sp.]